MKSKINYIIFFLIILSCDVLTKSLIMKNIPLYKSIEVFSFLNITHIENPGLAFGMFSKLSSSTTMSNLIIAIYIIVITVLIMLLIHDYRKYNKKLLNYGYILILAGAMGNLIDRLTLGRVIDFIDFHIGNWHYPSFNIADSSTTIGIFLIFIDILFLNRKHTHE